MLGQASLLMTGFVLAFARRASLRSVDSGIPRVHRLVTRTSIETLSMVAGMSTVSREVYGPTKFRLLGLTVMSSGNVLIANKRIYSIKVQYTYSTYLGQKYKTFVNVFLS